MITKSLYMLFRRCPRAAWMTVHDTDNVERTAGLHAENGTEVGDCARHYFDEKFSLIKKDNPVKMNKMTKLVMSQNKLHPICEASFLADDLFCSADIVLQNEDGSLNIYEVKSSSKVKDPQLEDAAFQMYVIEKCGYTIRRLYIMHVDTDYVLRGELDIKSLFCVKDITSVARVKLMEIERHIEECRALLKETTRPPLCLSESCDQPYACGCKAFCFTEAKVPEKSIFDVAGLKTTKKYELFRNGITTPEQMLQTAGLNEAQRIQVMGMRGAKTIVNTEAIKRFLDTITFPLYLLDFESAQFAIPRYDGTKPYEQVPFQYSLHAMRGFRESDLEHYEFLADARRDDRENLVKQLCADIPRRCMSMAYNSKFERMVMRHLAEQFPHYALDLRDIIQNMSDLMIPFQHRDYYNPNQNGSYSIKAVLPALVGEDDPTLDYHALPVVHNGVEAMASFVQMTNMEDDAAIAEIREGLLKYCKLDTLAMVKLLMALYNMVYGG